MIPETVPFAETRAFVAVFATWFISQFFKAILGIIKKENTGFRWIFSTGGMPSSHSATVSCLATVTGMYYGFRSMPFLFILIFSLITMFDAAGVRRNVGRQAKVINKMLDEFYEKGAVEEKRLKELLGHTPVEVFAGAFLGILIASLVCGV
jgi:uncharacterized protein